MSRRNDGALFLFTSTTTSLPVNNRNATAATTHDTERRKKQKKKKANRESVHMTIKKRAKVDERETSEETKKPNKGETSSVGSADQADVFDRALQRSFRVRSICFRSAAKDGNEM